MPVAGGSAGVTIFPGDVGSQSISGASGVTVSAGVASLDQTFAATWTALETFNAAALISQPATWTASVPLLRVTGAANTTNLTASTEVIDVNVNLARTVTWATGALATQRAVRIQAPTLAFAAASTVTTAVTLDVDGPPVAGSNATITNAFAARFGGSVQLTAGQIHNANGASLTLLSENVAASAVTDVLVNTQVTRTAGNLFDVQNNGASAFAINRNASGMVVTVNGYETAGGGLAGNLFGGNQAGTFAANATMNLIGNKNAADTGNDTIVRGRNTRTAGAICDFQNNTTSVYSVLFDGGVLGTQTASWSNTMFKLASANNSTSLTASTEMNDALFSFGHTVTFATGALTNQRAVLIKAPTYAFAGASTITVAAALAVDGAPAAGTNATITNSYAAWFGAKIRVDSGIALGGGQAPTLGTIGGSGPTAAAQNEWIEIHTQNGKRWVPAWA